ncbi:hypothetical protein [Natrinema sp. DC36]|uniref:SPW repeat domain-containing protein n=1 Tax=Natrinema sp. DC36 TaxID=2878680 RepID=UPI001CF0A199|nr:hypothetical protein [Natrinema sp. DC36]
MSGNRSVDDASVLVERTAGLTAAIGIFVLFSSVVFTITGNMGLHNVIAGAVIAFIASFHAFRSGEQHSPSAIIAVVLILLGFWMVASPFVFGISIDLVI